MQLVNRPVKTLFSGKISLRFFCTDMVKYGLLTAEY